jgi:lysophospholipase L1-like esterase
MSGKKTSHISVISIIYLTTVILTTCLNMALKWWFAGAISALQVDPRARTPSRESVDALADEQNVAKLFKELDEAKDLRWKSYVYWRRAAFNGEFIHVDEHGFRVTPQVVSANQAAEEVWLFGGSVVWGTGVDDAQSIAANLARVLAQRLPSRPIRVLNFGESGYVSRQAQLAFFSALKCTKARPLIVVFLDGANDVFAAFQGEEIGAPQNESNRIAEFNASKHPWQLLASWFAQLRGFAALREHLMPARNTRNIPDLAEAVVVDLLSTAAQEDVMASSAGAASLHFWQPTVFSKIGLSADEERIVGASQKMHRSLQLAVDLRIAAIPQYRKLDVERDVAAKTPLYFDFVHLNSLGLQRISEQIADDILGLLQDQPASLTPQSDCINLPVR